MRRVDVPDGHGRIGGRPKRGANEEATQPRSGRPNPTDPGGAADLSIPEGYLCFGGTELRTWAVAPARPLTPIASTSCLGCDSQTIKQPKTERNQPAFLT